MTQPSLHFLPTKLALSTTLGLLLVVASSVALAQESLSEISPAGAVTKVMGNFSFTEGPAQATDGKLYFTDIPETTIYALTSDDELQVFTKQSRHANGLLPLPGGKLLACEMDGQVVQYDLKSQQRTVLAKTYQGTRFNACNDLVVDAAGGIYFTDPLFRAPTPLPQEVQAVYYRSSGGEVTRVTNDLAAPNGIGLSPDGRRLYVIPSRQAEMLVYDVSAPGKVSGERVFCTLAQPEAKTNTGGDGMALDVKGNLYITSDLGIQIFSPDGQPRGIVAVPEKPANVTFGGADFKTMYMTARTGLYRVEMPIAGYSPLNQK
ncbi:MAG: SMP-30/gluconolactonase/LRE family protein [Planctomycetota bacterium]